MTYLTGHFINEEGLESIKGHKYVSGGYSTIDNIMNKWWEFIVSCVPMWVAPNILTLLGLMCNLVAYAVMASYDTSLG